MALRGILFDLEGTIVDSQLKRNPEEIDQERRNIKKKMIELGVPEEVLEGLEKPPLLRNRALDWIEANMNQASLIRFLAEFNGFMGITEMNSAKQAKLYPETLETLSILMDMGLKMGITTNAPKEAADYMLRTLGLEDVFSVVVTRNDAPRNKPNPAMIRIAVSRMGVPVRWLVGDSPYDAEAAACAGLHSIIVRRDGIKPSFSHDYFVDSLIKVESIVYCG